MGEEQELEASQDTGLGWFGTLGRFGLLLLVWLMDFSTAKWGKLLGIQTMPGGTHRVSKNLWVGANSPRAFLFLNLHLLTMIQVALAEKWGKELLCGEPVILSSCYSSWVRVWGEQIRTDFLIWQVLVLKYFIVLQNTWSCIWNRKSLFKICISRRTSFPPEAPRAIERMWEKHSKGNFMLYKTSVANIHLFCSFLNANHVQQNTVLLV